MASEIRRHFLTLRWRFGVRQVHYRRGGRGPVVLLLHQSPQSSREMEPLIATWGETFTLIAPDSPGYGFSDPLPVDGPPATIDDFAAATLEFADGLGIRRFGVYGFHTGASIGVGLAHAVPERVTAVAANGLVVMTEDEIADMLRHYLLPLTPRWDGGHLAWLWGRLREQGIFFPWYDRRGVTRMDFDVASPERLDEGVHEFLAAADHYAVAYAAAFAYRAERLLPALRVPVLVTAAARDPLASHLARIGARSDAVQVAVSADGDDALARSRAHLAAHPAADAGDACPPPPSTQAIEGRLWNDYRGAAGAQVRLRHAPATTTTTMTGANGKPRIALLHAPGGAATLVDRVALDLAACGDVLAADLPGHGGSDAVRVGGGESVLSATARQLGAALADVAGSGSLTILTLGTSAAVGVELRRLLMSESDPAPRLILVDPPLWSDEERDEWLREGLPALSPVWSGGHLLEAWHLVRDSRLFHPWFRRGRTGIRHSEPDLDDNVIQREVSALLRSSGAWQPLLRDILHYPLATLLSSRSRPADVVLAVSAGSPFGAARNAAGHPDLAPIELPSLSADWCRRLPLS